MKVPPRSSTSSSSSAAAIRRSLQSAAALRQFFALLESRYGGLPIDQGDRSEVIVSPNGILHAADLQRLVSHEATALHVQNFYPRPASQKLGQELAKEALQGRSRN
jgi:Mg2+/Co2+ transporter CorC